MEKKIAEEQKCVSDQLDELKKCFTIIQKLLEKVPTAFGEVKLSHALVQSHEERLKKLEDIIEKKFNIQ